MPIMDERLERGLAAGEVVIGGCIREGDDPEHRCNGCGYVWRSSSPDAFE